MSEEQQKETQEVSDNRENRLAESGTKPEAKEGKFEDDVYDGMYREVVSREVAHREGRDEGKSVTVEVPDDPDSAGADFVSYGQREMIERFDQRLGKDRVRHRGVEVGRYPLGDEEKERKVRGMANRQLSEATKRRKFLEKGLGLPNLPNPVEKKLTEAEGSETGKSNGGETDGESD